jgi:tRNA 2-thiouridine synthesizing protein A
MAGEETSGLHEVAEQIDVRGMQCPLPVLKARKRLKSLNNGELLMVLATDPAAVIDFPHFCNEAGHELVSTREDDGVLTFVIRKSHTS